MGPSSSWDMFKLWVMGILSELHSSSCKIVYFQGQMCFGFERGVWWVEAQASICHWEVVWKQRSPKTFVMRKKRSCHGKRYPLQQDFRWESGLSDPPISLSLMTFWGFSTSLMRLSKSAIIAWEFTVVQIALCKSLFNVTLFLLSQNTDESPEGRLKFHYQGGSGHKLKVKTWQHQAGIRAQNN